MTATFVPIEAQRPMRADARRNYDRVLSAARDAFTTHGPDASLDDIARRAGVGIGTLYRHFPTRLALQAAVIRDHADELAVLAEELLSSPSPGEALAAWLRSELTNSAKYGGLGAVVMNSLSDEESGLVDSCRSMNASAAALLARAQAAGDVRTDIDGSSLLRLVNAIAVANENAPDGAVQAERLLAIVLDGLRSKSALP